MSVAKTSEITASSSKSFEEAVRKGIRKMGETVDNLKFDNFRRQLEKQQSALKEKTGAKAIEFSVVRKNGKVSLTAKPKK